MKHRIILAILIVVVAPLWAQDSGRISTFTLGEAQKYALENKATSKNASLDVKFAKKRVYETAAIGFPQINTYLSYNNFIDIPTQVIPANAFDPTAPADLLIPVQFGVDQDMALGLSVNQLIFDGSYLVGLQAARTFVDLSRKNEQEAQIDVRYNVAKAYYAVLVSEESRNVIEENVKVLERIHFATDQMFKNGFVERLDVDRLQLSLSNLRVQLRNMERQADLAKYLLKFQMGLPMTDSIYLSDSLELLTSSLNQAIASDANIENRVEYQQLMINKRLAFLNLRRYQANRLPRIGGAFNYSTHAYRNQFDFAEEGGLWYPATMFGFRIDLPIIGFQNNALVQQAKIDLQKIENGKLDLEAALNLEVKQARANYLSAFDQYLTQSDNLETAREIHRVAEIKYNEGIGSSLEVSSAQTELNTTQTNYSSALFNLLNAKADLDKALGTN
jgi:outer membrane protein TolC